MEECTTFKPAPSKIDTKALATNIINRLAHKGYQYGKLFIAQYANGTCQRYAFLDKSSLVKEHRGGIRIIFENGPLFDAELRRIYSAKLTTEQEAETQGGQLDPAFVESVLRTFDEVADVFMKKNKQYSSDNDPLSNFREGAYMNPLSRGKAGYAEMYEEAKNYERKHLAHIEAHGIDAVKAKESLKDIMVYSAIQIYMIDQYEAQKKE